ncbi:MAG: hypothetical protein M3N24_02045 [Actinomycetota bacterium]|nr:hypothetical protein [Actinomycetota bacterium]
MATAASVEGWFYAISGLWPVINIRSFEWVTGPKVDRWLVKTVGLLLTAIGGVQIAAARRGDIPQDLTILGVGAPLALLLIDLTYVAKRRISKVYLLDALAQLGLIGLWGAAVASARNADQ